MKRMSCPLRKRCLSQWLRVFSPAREALNFGWSREGEGAESRSVAIFPKDDRSLGLLGGWIDPRVEGVVLEPLHEPHVSLECSSGSSFVVVNMIKHLRSSKNKSEQLKSHGVGRYPLSKTL